MKPLMVRDLMTETVYTVRPNESLAQLFDLMDEIHARHIPVVDDDMVIVGLVSQRDLIREALYATRNLPLSHIRELLALRKVRSIMTIDVETVDPDTPIDEAGELMLEGKFSCLPVAEGEHLVGILTEADFVKYAVGLNQRVESALAIER